MKSVSKSIVDALVTRGIVLEEDQAIYLYGVHQGFILLGNILTTFLIGWIYGMMLESLVLLFVYILLRSNAGGYHAKTPTRCYILSTVIVVAALSGIRYIPWRIWIAVSILLISCVIIVLLAPMENVNKPLEDIEKLVYKKRTRWFLGVFVGIAILFWVFYPVVSTSIVVAALCVAGMLVAGKDRRKIKVY